MNYMEMSNEFDILYNNITSNQAPNLDEYEKSVFLTKAQYDILNSYIDPNLNKSSLGLESSPKRQIDFSNIISVKTYTKRENPNSDDSTQDKFDNVEFENTKEHGEDSNARITEDGYVKEFDKDSTSTSSYVEKYFLGDGYIRIKMPNDILYILNERVVVTRPFNDSFIRKTLVVVPLTSTEWDRLSSKPYKRPAKNQAWRLLSGEVKGDNTMEIVLTPNDVFIEYIIRYLKTPPPIILKDLEEDGLSINGYTEPMDCALDSSIHEDIVQRAAELAKAVYLGGLNEQVQLGRASQTNIGLSAQAMRAANPYQQQPQ